MILVVTSMLNGGLTQKPDRLIGQLHNSTCVLRMLLLHFVVVPSLMITLLQIITLEPIYTAGLILFSLAAGAPFLIKLTSVSQADISLAVTVLLVLMVATVVVLPWVLPLVLEGVTVDTWAIIQALLIQLILPMVVGMVLLQVAERFVAAIQP